MSKRRASVQRKGKRHQQQPGPIVRIRKPDEPRTIGRPTKLTPDVEERFLKAVRAGNFPEAAAAVAGVSPRTWYNWKARAEAGEQRYLQFLQRVEDATQYSEGYAVAAWTARLKDDWRAAMKFLECRFGDRWANKSYQQRGANVTVNAQVNIIEAALEEVAEARAQSVKAIDVSVDAPSKLLDQAEASFLYGDDEEDATEDVA